MVGISRAILELNGVAVVVIRPVDHRIAHGVYADMTEHGWERDDWPAIQKKVMASDILVLCTPIWLGEQSSVCTQVVERLCGYSGHLNEHGQYAYCGRVGGCRHRTRSIDSARLGKGSPSCTLQRQAAPELLRALSGGGP